MDGDGAVRFCRRCEQQVRYVSAMSEAEARVFLAGGRQPCIRYTHDAGRIRFAERPGALSRLAAAAALAFGSLASSACMGKRACPVPPEASVAPADEAAAAKPNEPDADPATIAGEADKKYRAAGSRPDAGRPFWIFCQNFQELGRARAVCRAGSVCPAAGIGRRRVVRGQPAASPDSSTSWLAPDRRTSPPPPQVRARAPRVPGGPLVEAEAT
jgi:hypothetical protein